MDRPTRESKAAFWARMEREGQRDAAKAAEAELLATGMFRRKTQAALVQRFQPLDGTWTVAHPTPDPWANGRVDAKKPVSKLEQHDKDVEWAHDHPNWPPEEAPTPGARLLLVMLREKPVLFAKEWAKCVARIEERERQRREHRRHKVRARRTAKLQREADERQRIEDARLREENEKRLAEQRRKRAEEKERKEREARERAEWEERECLRQAEEAQRSRQEDEWLAEHRRQAQREQAELRALAASVQAVPAQAGEWETL